MTEHKLELPPCTSFCQNSDNSNGICRACLEREKTTHGILLNIAKRMTADNFVDYPQWLFTLIEEAIKLGTSAPHPQTVDVDGALEGLKIEALHKFNSCSATEKLLLLTFIDWLKYSGWIKEQK